MIKKIDKDLGSLSRKELLLFKRKWKKVISSDWSGLDIQKMKGSENRFRVRIGDRRIIFDFHKDGSYELRRIRKRDDRTYK